MNMLTRSYVWLSRVAHCRGYGIQSPTDYRFVRYVINEKWPYHAYEGVGQGDDWLTRKVGRLALRLANWRQPATIVDRIGFEDYLMAGCRSANLLHDVETIDMACVPITCNYDLLLSKCNENSVLLINGISKYKSLWHCIEYDNRTRQTFDLYYCGVVLFSDKGSRHNYIVNF